MTWTSTDGTEIPLIRIEDPHLLNIERMLRGDGAKQPEKLTDEETVRQHGMVLREMARRGLSPLPWIRDQPPQAKPYRATWVGVDVNLVRFMRIIAFRRGVDDHVVADEAMLDYVVRHQDEIQDVISEVLNRVLPCGPEPRFKVGDRVTVVRIVDPTTDRKLLGFTGTVSEVESLPEQGPYIQHNYYVDDHYLNEQMLQKAG